MLCSSRFEPPNDPSTCTLDSVLIPLPSFLLIVALICLLLFDYWRHRGSDLHFPENRRAYYAPRWTKTVYILFLVVALGMNLLQISRLARDHQGVGLLPFTLIGTIFAMILSRNSNSHHPSSYLLLPFWLLWTAFEAINIARLMKLEEIHPAKGSLYPTSDKLLDNVVLLVLYVIFLFYEIWILSMRILQNKRKTTGTLITALHPMGDDPLVGPPSPNAAELTKYQP